MNTEKISNSTFLRMPSYLNYLKSLPEDTKTVSATMIADALNLGDVLVRKDLAKISRGGRPRVGYLRKNLINDIEEFIDVKSILSAIIIGKGDLIRILLDHNGFEKFGICMKAGFDSVSKKNITHEGTIYPLDKLESYCKENQVSLAILMCSKDEAQEICDKVICSGISAIWNFTPAYLEVPTNVILHNENMSSSALKLRMQVKKMNKNSV
jgi:redox-sensing transcriptional repressor